MLFKRTTIPFIQFVLIVYVFLSFTACIDRTNKPRGQIVKELKEDYATLDMGDGYLLVNNVWNKSAVIGQFSQKIYEERVDGKKYYGWEWSVPSSSNVVSYPEIVYGDKPWDVQKHLIKQLPLQIGSTNLIIRFHILVKANGSYNTAFSFWINKSISNQIDTISHEIMIWTSNHERTPAGQFQGNYKINGYSVDLYINQQILNGNPMVYFTFVSQKPVNKGELHLNAFIKQLSVIGYDLKDYYVSSVEFGNEIQQGQGFAEVIDYSVRFE